MHTNNTRARRKLNAKMKRTKRAAALQLVVKATGRKAVGNGRDPNDRHIDRRTAAAVSHMRPQEFDGLLRHGEDDDA